MTDRRSSSRSHTLLRRAVQALAVTPAVLAVTASGTALASPPDTWEDTPHVSALYIIGVLVLVPLGLFLLITLLVYLPAMRHGTAQHQPGEGWRGEPEWFGGPRDGLAAADRAPAQLSDGSGRPGDAGPTRGGTSGRW